MSVSSRPALALLLAFATLSGGAATAQPASRGLQVALLLPLSGDYAHVGEALVETLTLALEQQPGLTWTIVDSEGDPAVAARRVRELAANPANLAVLGPVGAAESEAAAAVAAVEGLPLLTLTSEEGVENAGAFVFRMRSSPQEQARFMARTALDELGLQRVAALYPDDAFGRGAARAFVDEVNASGGRVTALEAYPADDANATDAVRLLVAQWVRVLRGGPGAGPPEAHTRHRASVSTVDFEALFVPDDAERVGSLLAFASFWNVPVGTRVQLLGVSSWVGPGLSLAGELANGALFSTIFNEGTYSVRAAGFAERFRASLGRAPTEADAQAWDVVTLLADTLLTREPAGGWTRASLRDTLSASSPVDGLNGPVEIGADGAVQRHFELFSVGSGGWVGPYVILR